MYWKLYIDSEILIKIIKHSLNFYVNPCQTFQTLYEFICKSSWKVFKMGQNSASMFVKNILKLNEIICKSLSKVPTIVQINKHVCVKVLKTVQINLWILVKGMKSCTNSYWIHGEVLCEDMPEWLKDTSVILRIAFCVNAHSRSQHFDAYVVIARLVLRERSQ